MEENIKINEKEIINEESKPENKQILINDSPNNITNLNNNIGNSCPPIINSEEDNKIKNSEDIKEKDDKNTIIQNNNKNYYINNVFINFPQIKKNKTEPNLIDLSKEQQTEKIENMLHSILSEVSTIKEKGNELYNNNNYEAAEKKYLEGIKKINDSPKLPQMVELNFQINDYLININSLNLQLYNNLSAALIKQKKYEETINNCLFIIENLNQEHVLSYCRLLFCLIETKKVILANHYAEIIKQKFGNENCFSKFQEGLARLEALNKEFSKQLLNPNPELKKEILSMSDDLKMKKDEGKKEENNIMKYIPYIIGGVALFFIGGRFLYKKSKKEN